MAISRLLLLLGCTLLLAGCVTWRCCAKKTPAGADIQSRDTRHTELPRLPQTRMDLP